MAATISSFVNTSSVNGAPLWDLLKLICSTAGFPTPIQDYTTAYPYFLVFELNTNHFLVFSVISIGSNSITIANYKTWNTSTRTGTGGGFTSSSMNFGLNNTTHYTISESSAQIGLVVGQSNSDLTRLNYSFGFIKLANKASYYPVDYPSTFVINFGNAIYNSQSMQTYGTEDMYGTLAYPDTITKNIVPVGGVDRNLISPVLLFSGGQIIGTTNDRIAYCPNLNQIPGARLIVTPGVEEYIYAMADIAVRDI